MRRVSVYEVGARIQTVEAEFLEFHSHPGFSIQADDWQRPLNAQEKYVRYSAPIHRLHQGGEDFYVAFGPGCVDRVAMALQPELAQRIQKLETEAQESKERIALLRGHVEEFKWLGVELTASLNQYRRAGFWRRLKYAFTRGIR